MKIFFIILMVIWLAGCGGTIPVKPAFPDAADQLAANCEKLTTLPNVTNEHPVKLSDATNVIVSNYEKANKCAVLVNSWKEWYVEQKKIYDKVSK